MEYDEFLRATGHQARTRHKIVRIRFRSFRNRIGVSEPKRPKLDPTLKLKLYPYATYLQQKKWNRADLILLIFQDLLIKIDWKSANIHKKSYAEKIDSC